MEPPETPEPYALVFAAVAQMTLPGLPVEARMALADVLERVMHEPWSGERYHPKMPSEMRTDVFGDGAGIVQWVTSDKQQRVIVTQVLWAD